MPLGLARETAFESDRVNRTHLWRAPFIPRQNEVNDFTVHFQREDEREEEGGARRKEVGIGGRVGGWAGGWAPIVHVVVGGGGGGGGCGGEREGGGEEVANNLGHVNLWNPMTFRF